MTGKQFYAPSWVPYILDCITALLEDENEAVLLFQVKKKN